MTTLRSCLAIFIFSSIPVELVYASCTSSGSPPTISANCTGGYAWISGDVTNNATIRNDGNSAFYNTASTGNFINNGTLEVVNNWTVAIAYDASSFTNNGIIEPISGTSYNLVLTNNSTLGSLTNSAGSFIRISEASGNAIYLMDGAIGNLLNHGQISASGSFGTGITLDSMMGNSVISNLTNYGVIYGGSNGILVAPNGGPFSTNNSIGTLLNSGDITGYSGYAIKNEGIIGTLTNESNKVISGGAGGGSGIYNAGTISVLNNSGDIGGLNGNVEGISNAADGVISNLVNFTSGNIIGNGDMGIQNFGSIPSLINYGTITGDNNGIDNENSILTLTNFRSITSNSNSYAIFNQGSIATLTNTGVISNGGIYNGGFITVLNNLQGQGSRPLAFDGNLPSNYNAIINSRSSYGQLQVNSVGAGPMAFGIYGGGISGVAASILSKGTYLGVLSGIAASNLTGTTGGYSGFIWNLVETDNVDGVWSLLVSGASTADTQQSLVNTASALQSAFALQNTVLANSFSYDCTVFGENNACVSVGGRNTTVSAANGLNNTSGLLIAAYKAHPQIRIGAYVDQNLSMNNGGSTVNLNNNTPVIGLFGAWNERLDGTGAEVKVSAAYGQKNAAITRQVVGTSEPGSGSSQLNSQGAQVTTKYGFAVLPEAIVSPYLGMRYTQNNLGGYSEGASATVTAPLTYGALNTNATTALAGVGASYRFIPKATLFASAGVETDTNAASGTYSASGISGLTPINFNVNPVKTRPTATLGAYYDFQKNQRLGITGIYRQEPFQAVSTNSVMASYIIGL